MATRLTCVLALALWTAACGGEEKCEDPTYGNGTCDLAGACGTVDIDCFTIFDKQADAQAWMAERESLVAQAQGTTPRPLVAANDPRFAAVQKLLDDGWEAYKATHKLYDLGEHEPQLVVIDSAFLASAAFVAADHRTLGKTAALAVMVETDLIERSPTDEELLSVMMHELEHAVGLHVLPAISDGMVKAYIASPGEPLGFEQVENPVARDHLDDWQALAHDVGHLSNAVLAGMPLGGSAVFDTMDQAIEMQRQTNAAGCSGSLSALSNLYQQVAGNIDELSLGISLNDPNMIVLTTFTRLRTECFTSFPYDFIAAHAMVTGESEASIIATLTSQELSQIDNVNFVTGMYNYTLSRRNKLRDVEASFQTATGQPWAKLRYYSTEEAADDSSVSVMTEIGREPRALGDFFVKLGYSPAAQTTCNGQLASGTVPHYGEDLVDDHHSSCWRAYHVDAMIDAGVFAARRSSEAVPPLTTSAPRISSPRWRPLPKRAPVVPPEMN